MSSWNPQANSLFLNARELPAGPTRQAYLHQACAGNRPLSAEVEALLESDERAGEFLERPCEAVDVALPTRPIEGPGDWVGPYKLLQEIGEGGMGLVFLAEQTDPVRRTVALKIIKPGMDTRQVVARFEAEWETLALMDHPNIARVLDAGMTSAGRPYFVMELVKGLPITEYCDQQRLTVRERLRLFVPICQAIQHAHQKGTIHRDLKPSNVMIALYDGCPVPKVIDFGVAKATGPSTVDRTFFTEYGAVLGTLEYMSPEQAGLNQLDVDTRSDIYSLGVLLYELLTGTTPVNRDCLTKLSLLDVLRTIRDEIPIQPSVRIGTMAGLPLTAARRGVEPQRLKRLVRGDLDWIVMKALEKNRNQRYQNANDLLREIERHLADLPVHTRPIGTLRRTWRWCRRNPYVSALLTLVLLLVTSIALGASISVARLQQQSDAARAARDRAVRAEQARRQELVQTYLAKAQYAPITGTFAERQAVTAAIHGAPAAVPWHELTSSQRDDLVNAAIPSLISCELRDLYRLPLSMSQNDHYLREIDVDCDLAKVALPTKWSPSTVIERLDATRERRVYALSAQEPLTSPSVRLFSPHGRWLLEATYVLSSESHQRFLVWDLSNGTLCFDRSQPGIVEVPVFHPDEQHVLVPDADGRTLTLSEIVSGRVVAKSPPRFRGARPAYSEDGKYLAIASISLPAEIVDAATWNTVASLAVIGRAASVAWHPRELWAAFGTADGKLFRWQPSKSQTLDSLGRGHSAGVNLLVFSPDGRLLASNDEQHRFAVRRTEDNHILMRGSGCVIRFSPDGRRIAVIDNSQLIISEMHEAVSYRQLNEIADAAVFSPNRRWLGVSGRRGVRLFDTDTLHLVADLCLDHCGPVAFHPSEAFLTTFGCFSHAWNWPVAGTALGPPRPLLADRALSTGRLAPQHRGRHAVWSPDGRSVVWGDYRDGKVLIWNGKLGSVSEFATASSPVQVAMSADGRWLGAGLARGPRTVVWDTTDRHEVLGLDGFAGLAFSPEGSRFAARSQASLDIYRVPAWELQQSIQVETTQEQRGVPPAFQPGGGLLAVTDMAQRVRLFDCETGFAIATLDDRDTSPVTWLSFSPDGRRLAVTRAERIAIWNLPELANELKKTGLHLALTVPVTDAPPTPSVASDALLVDRGTLPPPDRWHTLWQRMARYEARQGNYPDAIDDMNKAWQQVPDIATEKAALLAERGAYFRQNLSDASAIEDWQAALRWLPHESIAATGLARMYVTGPPTYRDPHLTLLLATMLSQETEPVTTGKILLAMAHVRLGQAETIDREVLASASSLRFEESGNEWRLLAGYFLVLDACHHDVGEATRIYGSTRSLHEQLLSSLTLAEKLELDRIKSEVETLLGNSSVRD